MTQQKVAHILLNILLKENVFTKYIQVQHISIRKYAQEDSMLKWNRLYLSLSLCLHIVLPYLLSYTVIIRSLIWFLLLLCCNLIQSLSESSKNLIIFF